MSGEVDITWTHPHTGYQLAIVLYSDKTANYVEFARHLRDNQVSLEDRIGYIEQRIQTLWDTVFP